MRRGGGLIRRRRGAEEGLVREGGRGGFSQSPEGWSVKEIVTGRMLVRGGVGSVSERGKISDRRRCVSEKGEVSERRGQLEGEVRQRRGSVSQSAEVIEWRGRVSQRGRSVRGGEQF